MTTSGTVGRTVIDATTVIEHAVRRCGVLATAITGEMQTSLKENLFLILSNFVTKGMELWCVGKTAYPTQAGAATLELELGWVDVENGLLRTVTSTAADALFAGGAAYTPGSALTIDSAVLELPVGTYTYALEGSADGSTWALVGSRSFTIDASIERICIDAMTFTSYAWWRLREVTASATLPLAATFCSNASEIPMYKMSRDDYVQMPNKAFPSRPLQFWFDKQTPRARLWFWPVPPDSTTYQCVIWGHRQIQDVGDLNNTLDAPQRWMDAVISELATRACLELPAQLVPPGRYDQLLLAAASILRDVQDAEIDGSPVSLAPSIRAYTR